MRPIFFVELFQIKCIFKNWIKKLRLHPYFLSQFHLNWLPKVLPIIGKILFIGTQCVNKRS